MAVYKVPQDVEADDKLIGPFTFRQFIYLIVVAISIAIGYFLSRIFIGLIVLPLPVVLFFGALALPLRKDQPMETYLLAMIRFYFKPKNRLWDPDGNLDNVVISAQQIEEQHLTKDYGSDEANRRLSYLAQVIDTGGWASRGVIAPPPPSTNMIDTYYNEAMSTQDVMDTSNGVAASFDALIDREDARRKQTMTQQFQQAFAQPQTTPDNTGDDMAMKILENASHLEANPYPVAMNQTIIQPMDDRHKVRSMRPGSVQPPQRPSDTTGVPQQTMTDPTQQAFTLPSQQPSMTTATPPQEPTKAYAPQVSSDIMRLANNSSHLSVEALAHEAHRLESKDDEEVVINLR